jgi:predicted phage tail protein
MGAKFGRVHRVCLETNTPAEAIQYLRSQFPGIDAYLIGAKDRGVGFSIFAGKQNLCEDQLTHPVGNDDIRIAPIILGSKNSGIFQVIIGAILVVVGAYFANPAIINLGVGIALGGVAQLLTPMPKGLAAKDTPGNTPSYTFNGPLNTEAQGHPVPLLYGGPMKVGSAVISAGIDTLDTSYYPGGQAPGNGSMGGGGGCVLTICYVHVVRADGSVEAIRACDVRVGDILLGADPVTLEPMQHEVTYSEAKWQPCVELETLDGILLPCSHSAPIPTESGELVLAPDIKGHQVAEMDALGMRWAGIHLVREIGLHMVQHISIDNGCFWAGIERDKSMLHHNKLAVINAQEGR